MSINRLICQDTCRIVLETGGKGSYFSETFPWRSDLVASNLEASTTF